MAGAIGFKSLVSSESTPFEAQTGQSETLLDFDHALPSRVAGRSPPQGHQRAYTSGRVDFPSRFRHLH
ncbi:MAG: hypothetical protein IGR76_02805 [Synechococcales cyanobacterium T60_A2020_003]|nr:hypothetical protein [Synechococcales cyanobacterium T60_A2020_003]